MVLKQEELHKMPDDNPQKSAMGKQLPNYPFSDSGTIDKQLLTAPIKSATDKFQLLPEFLKIRGLVKQHLDSYNYFIETEMQKILDANNIIRMTKFPQIYLRFLKIRIGKPSVSVDTAVENITPHTCRLTDLTYAAPINVDIEYVSTHDVAEKRRKNNLCIGRMPIMLRSHSCVLHGKDEAELARLGECPLDPGGYFIIKGTEKVILIQEQLSKNRIILDTDKKGNINASVTASTDKIKTKTVIVMEHEKMWVQLNVFPKKVPLMVVMKGMGMESDQEVIQMIGRDPRYSLLLMPSIEECSKNGVYTQQQALEYLDSKAKSFTYSNNSSEKEGRAFRILKDVFLAHVPVHQNNFRAKCIYAAVMMRRMMDAILNKDAMDDKPGSRQPKTNKVAILLDIVRMVNQLRDEAKKLKEMNDEMLRSKETKGNER